jgi:hypothetical protein
VLVVVAVVFELVDGLSRRVGWVQKKRTWSSRSDERAPKGGEGKKKNDRPLNCSLCDQLRSNGQSGLIVSVINQAKEFPHHSTVEIIFLFFSSFSFSSILIAFPRQLSCCPYTLPTPN